LLYVPSNIPIPIYTLLYPRLKTLY